jgi:hypothetical protein
MERHATLNELNGSIKIQLAKRKGKKGHTRWNENTNMADISIN